MAIKQSVCFPMMEPLPLPLEEFLPQVAAMGFKAVEIWHPDESFQRLAELCHKQRLTIASFSGHQNLSSGLNDRAQHARICSELRHSIDLAADNGVPGIICFSGKRLAGQAEADAIEACVEGLRMVAPYAEQKGVNLNLELLNSLVDHPGYQCDHSAWGLQVVDQVASPKVKLLYDIYHMQIMEGNLIDTITRHIDCIGHFHTAGVPGRNDPDETQEINYAAVSNAISGSGYALYVGHEYRPKGELFASLKKTYGIFNQ